MVACLVPAQEVAGSSPAGDAIFYIHLIKS